jgi:DnaJ-domain-containing protein 1
MIKWLIMSIIVMFVFDWIRRTMDRGAQKRLPRNKQPPQVETRSSATRSSPRDTLGVQRSATWDEIQTAYKKRVAEYHPDKVATSAPEIRELAEKRLRELNDAYAVLSKEHGR